MQLSSHVLFNIRHPLVVVTTFPTIAYPAFALIGALVLGVELPCLSPPFFKKIGSRIHILTSNYLINFLKRQTDEIHPIRINESTINNLYH
jgi:hypothetical protein